MEHFLERAPFRKRSRNAVAALIAVLVCATFSTAATYYVSVSGNNQAGGATPSTPFATLSFAATKLKARDTLLLRRGDVFRDSIKLTTVADPVIGGFGPAGLPKPVVCGSDTIASWSVHAGNVWAARCDRSIEKLFVNGGMMPLARYPDTGWLRIDTLIENSDGSGSVIHCAALAQHPHNAAGYWNNAQIRWRRWSWWYETRTIAAYDAPGRLSLEGKSIIHISLPCRGWGFYIDNKLQELDAPGEWWYDSAAKKVFLYPPGGANPNTMLVEGTVRSMGIELAGGTVIGVCVKHQTLYGISLSKKSVVADCRFEGIGGDGGGAALRATWDIADSHIFGNRFENNLNTGISWYENSGRLGATVIERDTLISTGVFPGYGGSGTWHAVGILVHLSKNVLVRNNYIDKTGYAGILLGSDSNFVRCNIIKNAMYTLNDGAAIYTDCNKSFIGNNIIYDTKGDLSSCGPWYPLGHGIWLEYLEDYRESVVENNTIVRSGSRGIYLPNNFSCDIRNNVLFDNAGVQLEMTGEAGNAAPQNNRIKSNVCYATSRTQKSLLFRPDYDYGVMNGNYFCNPYTDSVVSGYGSGNNKWKIFDYTLARWKSLFAWADDAPKSDPFKRPPGIGPDNPYGKARIFINESPAAMDFSLGAAAYKDLDGNAVTGTVTVPPFYSKILVRADSSLTVAAKGAGENARVMFRGDGIFRYRIAKKSAVTLVVYSAAGRTVLRLRRPESAPGDYSLCLDARNGRTGGLTPGIYVYRFTATSGGTAVSAEGKLAVTR